MTTLKAWLRRAHLPMTGNRALLVEEYILDHRKIDAVKLLMQYGADKGKQVCPRDDVFHSPIGLVNAMPEGEKCLYTEALNTPPLSVAERQIDDSLVKEMCRSMLCHAKPSAMPAYGMRSLLKKCLGEDSKESKAELKKRLQAEQTRIRQDPNELPEDCVHLCTVAELKHLARRCKLSVTGTKWDLVERFREWKHKDQPAPAPEVDELNQGHEAPDAIVVDVDNDETERNEATADTDDDDDAEVGREQARVSGADRKRPREVDTGSEASPVSSLNILEQMKAAAEKQRLSRQEGKE